MKRIIKEVAILTIAALTAAFIFNYYYSKGIALVGQWEKESGVVSAKSKDSVIEDRLEIITPKAKKIYDSNKGIFVDARSRSAYNKKHIYGAVSFPINEFDLHIDNFTTQYPPSTLIVAYCLGRDCEDSHRLAQNLIDLGYKNINVFIDGFSEWEQKGYPVE